MTLYLGKRGCGTLLKTVQLLNPCLIALHNPGNGVGATNLDFLIFLCSLLSQYTFSTKIVWQMTFIYTLEHSVQVSFDSVRIHFLFLPELKFIFNIYCYSSLSACLQTVLSLTLVFLMV